MSTEKIGEGKASEAKGGDAKVNTRHIRLTSHPGQQGTSGAPTIRMVMPNQPSRTAASLA